MAVSTLVGKVITMATADDTYPGKIIIDYISWVGCTGAGTATLENTAGEVIWAGSSSAAGETVDSRKFHNGLSVTGLKIEDLPSGTCCIYLR